MFILNKKTKVIQECFNADAIKSCKKDPEHYAVAATREELAGEASPEPQKEPGKEEGGELDTQGQKEDPEGNQEGQEGREEEGQAGGDDAGAGNGWQDLPDEEREKALNDKNVAQLREIAKEMKIQGYGNMNKGTLVAMIMNH